MKIEEIKELLRVLENSSFSKIEIDIKEDLIKLERNQAIINCLDEESLRISDSEICADDDSMETIKSPMVGVFHDSRDSKSKVFVKKGDKVKKGDVVGIIEAMKLMNEIESPLDGQVMEICVENNDVVGYGDILMKIKVE